MAKLAAWLSGKPYSPKPRIWLKQFSAKAVVPARCHPPDEVLLEIADRADAAERRHCAAQAVGFDRREFGGFHGDAHRLLLEQRNAERVLQDALEFVLVAMLRRRRWVVRLLTGFAEFLPPLQIRMHHLSLDRPRPHDRDLDDQVEEFLRPQSRQHRHLRPAFDLEGAERVGALDHLVDGLAFLFAVLALFPFPAQNARHRFGQAVMHAQKIEAAPQARQHAEPEDIDLQQPELIEIILVPFDDGAVLHRGVLDRHDLVDARARDQKAADML